MAGNVGQLLPLLVHLVLGAWVKLPRHSIQGSTAHPYHPKWQTHISKESLWQQGSESQPTQAGEDSRLVQKVAKPDPPVQHHSIHLPPPEAGVPAHLMAWSPCQEGSMMTSLYCFSRALSSWHFAASFPPGVSLTMQNSDLL